MSLNILTINPANDKNDITIDSAIVIEFDNEIDPFSVASGISLYTKKDGLWSGPDLAQLDTDYSNVLDINENEAYYQYSYQINNNVLTLLPSVSLIPDKEHFLSIYPGSDATRYLSKKTVGTPIIVGDPDCKIDFTSSYTGNSDDIFEISFTATTGGVLESIQVYKGVMFQRDVPFVLGAEINVGELKFILNGSYNASSSISIPVYKAEGVSSVYQIKFTTSKYTTITPKSHKIEYFGDAEVPLSVVKVTPDDNSVNNQNINPIIIQFNKELDPNQELLNKIAIKRTDLTTAAVRNIKHYYRILGNTLKIYMLGSTRNIEYSVTSPEYKIYFGSISASGMDDTALALLDEVTLQSPTKKDVQFNCTGGKYIYIVTPASFPMLKITSGGVIYNDITVSDMMLTVPGSPSVFSRVYRTTNLQTAVNILLTFEG